MLTHAQSIFLMEQGIRRFDLRDPFDAIELASVLLTVASLSTELATRLEAQEEHVLEKVCDSGYAGWSIYPC